MSVVVVQVPGDGVGAGVQAGVGQLLAEPHDQVDHLRSQGGRGGLGASGPGFERGLALGLVAGLELVDPGAVHAVAGGDLGGGLVVDEQGGDDQAGFRHGLRHGRASAHEAVADDLRHRVAYVLRHLSPMS